VVGASRKVIDGRTTAGLLWDRGGGGERKKKTLCPACNPPSIWTLTTPRRLVEKSYLESGMLSLYGCSRCAVSCLCLALHACRFHSLLAYSLTPFLRSWVFCFLLLPVSVPREQTARENRHGKNRSNEKKREKRMNFGSIVVGPLFLFFIIFFVRQNIS
jgi:hypothetical protein